jgi:hypothetical protein
MAFGASTISDFGGGVSDLFAASADQTKADALRLKAQGDVLEGQNYGLASDLATQNEQFTAQSTAIKQAQLDRSITQTIGGQQADVAGAGFAASGSALDLMRDSASQGALTKAVAGQQGLITEAGYQEQATSYTNMQKAAGPAAQEDTMAADAADKAAEGADITGGLKIAAGVASLFTGGASDAITGLFTGGSGFTPQAPSDPNNPLVINQYGKAGDNPPGQLPGVY